VRHTDNVATLHHTQQYNDYEITITSYTSLKNVSY